MADQKARELVFEGGVLALLPESPAGDVWFAEATILGVPHRVTFLRVEANEEGYWKTVSEEWAQELEKLYALTDADGELLPVEVPDLDGQFLCYVYPSTL